MSTPPQPSPANDGEKQEQQEQFNPIAFMSNFDPELVHRVLLTDPSDYAGLTMSGQPRLVDTPSYNAQFLWENGFISDQESPPSSEETEGGGQGAGNEVALQMARTMKRAFHAAIVEAVDSRNDIADVKALILELHEKMRGLIPSRADLHDILSDDDVHRMNLVAGDDDASSDRDGETRTANARSILIVVLPHLIKAAGALVRLESEDRSVTTSCWIEMATRVLNSAVENVDAPDLPPDISPATFVVSSLTYLHIKADLCASDIADYHLSTVLAPQIATHGPEYERALFQQRFGVGDGDTDNDESTPITRQWIKRTVDECGVSRQELLSNEERRVTVLQTSGWVNLILFQTTGEGHDDVEQEGNVAETSEASQVQPFIHVPEVLQSDISNLRSIRETTKMSVIGSALALHACNVAGVGDAVLRREPSTAEINQCRKNLIKSMSDKSVTSQEAFEKGISAAVIDLARVLKPSLGSEEEKILSSRTPAVMKGDDPVIKLLDNRMRLVFCEMMSWTPDDRDRMPTRMSTGRQLRVQGSDDGHSAKTISSQFQAAAKEKFMHRGFAFYATELAEASLTATKVINLAFVVYGETLLDPVFLTVLQDG
mmetsp:Transcript_964/g.2028  ORF Transcript_964/g.2028 Transcript_964/m.2028 type:complete len:602 (-) Transcript_964:268-2073(-)